MAMLTRAARRLLPACSLLLGAAARPHRRTTHSKVHGIFINYIDHDRPHLFARPSPTSSGSSPPIVDAMFDFLPDDDYLFGWWSLLDHSNGLPLCDMGRDALVVCNPATRRWTLIPCPRREGDRGVYLAFDPAVSPHYEVLVVPAVPPEAEKPPFVDDDTSRRLLESEWPPTPWRLNVFSSKTGQWEKRAFVRQGEPAGTVRELLVMDQGGPFRWGEQQRYAVYCRGALYVHCRGCFVLRLWLSNGTYQVIRAPTYKESGRCVTPYLGRSENMVYFGTVEEPQRLRVWVLAESNGRMEWILKYREDLVPLAQHLTKYGRPIDAPWMVHDVSNVEEDVPAKTLTKRRFEWDSDDDDFFTIKRGDKRYYKYFVLLGFHPYKEVVYLNDVFGVVAYHLKNSKVQYLGNSRPNSYYLGHSNGIYESFVYTPSIVGELNEENIERSSS